VAVALAGGSHPPTPLLTGTPGRPGATSTSGASPRPRPRGGRRRRCRAPARPADRRAVARRQHRDPLLAFHPAWSATWACPHCRSI